MPRIEKIEGVKAPNRRTGYFLTHAFDDVGDFANECEKVGVSFGPDHWSGQSGTEALRCARLGMPSMMNEARDLLEKIDAEGLMMPRKAWQTSLVGAFPNVPAFLAGEHESMWNLTDDSSEFAPIRIFLSTITSSAIGDAHIRKQGAAALALLSLLCEIRPVELWLFTEIDSGSRGANCANVMIRVNTAPLDLSVAAYIMGHSGFTRGLMHEYAIKTMGFQGGWAFDMGGNEEGRMKLMGKQMGATKNDLVLPGKFLDSEAANNPIPWIMGQIKKLISTLEV